jgi:hypothetical protein
LAVDSTVQRVDPGYVFLVVLSGLAHRVLAQATVARRGLVVPPTDTVAVADADLHSRRRAKSDARGL